MKNWLKQDIAVGTVVGRGDKQGSTQHRRLGVVTDVHDDRRKARVRWLYLNSSYTEAGGYVGTESVGTCDIDSLFVLADDVLLNLAEPI